MYLTLPKATRKYLKLLSEKIQDTEEARRAFEEYCRIIEEYSDQIGVSKPKDGIYRETHHILPAYYCRELHEEGVHDKQNLINLPIKLHLLCHIKLAVFTDDFAMRKAVIMMVGRKQLPTKIEDITSMTNEYQTIREAYVKTLSDRMGPVMVERWADADYKKRLSESHKASWTQEKRQNHSRVLREYHKNNPEAAGKFSVKAKETWSNLELRESRRLSLVAYYKENASHWKGVTGDKHPLYNTKQTVTKCPHCDTKGGASNMTRYHFDNCKLK